MITQLEGRLVEKNLTDIVISCQGIGYIAHISLHTYGQIKDSENLKIYTHLLIRDDAHTLYGFATKLEREMFRLLISVSGIGASTARTMLSSLTPKEIQNAIAGEDDKTIQSIKGIGVKTAQRVVLDLKDKVIKLFGIDEVSTLQNNTLKDEALSALEVLGYNKRQAEKTIDKIRIQHPEANVEFIIKEALNKL